MFTLSSIWSIDRTLSCAYILDQRRLGSNDNKVLHGIPQCFSITRASPSYPWHFLAAGEVLLLCKDTADWVRLERLGNRIHRKHILTFFVHLLLFCFRFFCFFLFLLLFFLCVSKELFFLHMVQSNRNNFQTDLPLLFSFFLSSFLYFFLFRFFPFALFLPPSFFFFISLSLFWLHSPFLYLSYLSLLITFFPFSTTPNASGPGNNSNERVLYTLQISWSGASSSDAV